MDYNRPKYAYTPGPENLSVNGVVSASMDFAALDQLRDTLTDAEYIEYIFHKLFDNPDAQFAPGRHTVWNFPECWLARYWCYFVKHADLVKDARILELGSNLNFYSVWAMLNGACQVDAIEPESRRIALGTEYVKLRGLERSIVNRQVSIDEFMYSYKDVVYDVVFFLDVMYYLTNPIDVLAFIKNRVRPKYLFLESSVIEDYCANGHFEFWAASTETNKMQTFSNTGEQFRSALMPSRNVLHSVINQQGWEIVFYYDYHDFVGHGESPPRRAGQKSFFVLKNPESRRT